MVGVGGHENCEFISLSLSSHRFVPPFKVAWDVRIWAQAMQWPRYLDKVFELGGWFQFLLILTPTWGRFPLSLIFFKWVGSITKTSRGL